MRKSMIFVMTLGGCAALSASAALSAAATGASPIVTPVVAPARDGGPLPPSSCCGERLGPLVDLVARRLLLGDKVAAAKFGTDLPIDDPARERQVLDQVAATARSMGLDVDAGLRFFRAQIDAGKAVQRGLFALWTAHPDLAPTTRPDLKTQVRPELVRLTTELMRQLQATRDVRADTPGCVVELRVTAATAEYHHHLDGLHRKALRGALGTVCAAPPDRGDPAQDSAPDQRPVGRSAA